MSKGFIATDQTRAAYAFMLEHVNMRDMTAESEVTGERTSKMFDAIGYHGGFGRDGNMYLTFSRDGSVYRFDSVPVQRYARLVAMMKAGQSVGSYFAREIGRYHKGIEIHCP